MFCGGRGARIPMPISMGNGLAIRRNYQFCHSSAEHSHSFNMLSSLFKKDFNSSTEVAARRFRPLIQLSAKIPINVLASDEGIEPSSLVSKTNILSVELIAGFNKMPLFPILFYNCGHIFTTVFLGL